MQNKRKILITMKKLISLIASFLICVSVLVAVPAASAEEAGTANPTEETIQRETEG